VIRAKISTRNGEHGLDAKDSKFVQKGEVWSSPDTVPELEIAAICGSEDNWYVYPRRRAVCFGSTADFGNMFKGTTVVA
jgi:hypothetical protein